MLLRFFEKRPFAEIGAMLALSEDAAQKRVDRALGKLRLLLSRRGVTSTASAVVLVLSEQTLTAAPRALSATISSAAMAVPSGGALGCVVLMSSIKTAAVSSAAILLVTVALTFSVAHLLLGNVSPPPRPAPPRLPAAVVTRLGPGSLPLTATALPDPQAEFASALALEEPWLGLFRQNPTLAKAFLRMLGQSTPALGMQTAARFLEQGFSWAANDVLAGWFTADPVTAWNWYLGHRFDGQLNVGSEQWSALIAAGGAQEAAAQIETASGRS